MCPPFSIRQNANSLSNANKLLIRCAWAGTSAFTSAGYGSSWGPGSCPSPPPSPLPPSPPASPPGTFTSKVSLEAAVLAFTENADAAIATYGPFADWEVSGVSDMSRLFFNLRNFNVDVSNWDTSGVTDMRYMFRVRSAHAL